MKLKKMFILVPVLLAGLSLTLVNCSGCATLGDPLPRLTVRVIDENQFEVENRIYDLGQLPKAMKKAGATRDTLILLQKPAEMAPRALDLIAYGTLKQYGFTKIMYITPREVTTQVGKPVTDTATAPANKKAPRYK